MISIIRKIEEGESYTSAIIGYKLMRYRGLDDQDVTALRVGLYLGFVLIKIEFIRI